MLLIDKRFKEDINNSETLKNSFSEAQKKLQHDWKMDVLISKELIGHNQAALNKPVYMWVVVIYKGAMLVRKEAKNSVKEIVESLIFFTENYEIEYGVEK